MDCLLFLSNDVELETASLLDNTNVPACDEPLFPGAIYLGQPRSWT